MSGRTRRAIASVVLLGGLGGLGGLLALAPASRAAAASSRSFDAVASADGVRTLLASPGAPLSDQIVDAGGPSAQAHLSSIGTSTAFGAYPDPGATVLGIPALTGTSYPLAVSSSYPVTPSQKAGNGPYVLVATSEQTTSAASAQSGSSDGTATGAFISATAKVSQQGDTVVATAGSHDSGLATGPLALGRVRATATAFRGASGAPQRSSSFSAEGLSAAGMTFGIGPKGLTVGGTDVPLPDDSPITSVLEQAGITLTYFAPQQTENGIISAGLQVTAVSSGGQRTSYVFGQASARVAQTVSPDAALPAAPATGIFEPPTGTGDSANASADPPPFTGAPVDSGAAVGTPVASAPDVAPAAPVAGPQAVPALNRGAAVVGWPRSYFLVLAGGGLMAALAGTLFSTLGVRYP